MEKTKLKEVLIFHSKNMENNARAQGLQSLTSFNKAKNLNLGTIFVVSNRYY